ncbi:MAG TPA: HD domain-containing protein [Longimicrobiaceae bacterium]|nr:HD domain-containing protein [Longimicrobiaceae bacterium]
MTSQESTSTTELSPLLRDAARGVLPPWTRVSAGRLAHMGRVAALLREWAERLRLPETEADRWCAAGWLHDALRDAPEAELRGLVPDAFCDVHPLLLHGPACAEKVDGDADEEFREAVRYHTLGSASFGMLGKALYLADFMEPGRSFDPAWTASLRARMPGEMAEVLREVVDARVRHVGGSGEVHPATRAFHRAVMEGAA